MSIIGEDEQEILEAYDAGELYSVGSAEERARLSQSARATGIDGR